jgi:hypothetical protein
MRLSLTFEMESRDQQSIVQTFFSEMFHLDQFDRTKSRECRNLSTHLNGHFMCKKRNRLTSWIIKENLGRLKLIYVFSREFFSGNYRGSLWLNMHLEMIKFKKCEAQWVVFYWDSHRLKKSVSVRHRLTTQNWKKLFKMERSPCMKYSSDLITNQRDLPYVALYEPPSFE